LTANISKTGHDIDKETQTLSRTISAALEKTISRAKLLFTSKKVINADVDLLKFKIRRNFEQLQILNANISAAN